MFNFCKYYIVFQTFIFGKNMKFCKYYIVFPTLIFGKNMNLKNQYLYDKHDKVHCQKKLQYID